jgi:hypothetical protein
MTMMKMLKKLILMVVLLSTGVAFADEDPGSGMEESNGSISESALEDEAPLDSQLLYLGLAGIAFGLYYYSSKPKKAI